ncbi:sensor histidine kinase [Mycolicibacterium brumae]|uniref:histidine kinase n=1 Tax=Mycolicibacterium brumae TaxID=85968 RepID=A0A2G5P7X8_9MYCO|nr:histidine kinase [Mycolicibacterium brumae]MCV7194599.1 ATP-binding protein [Mycolicibacterium brumae]PIB74200.1 two-component sensor histidine kinase [Mycolicibacterium brumae]UWW08938.1 histidine kinase [Mycolicibacterium brumae]
MASPRFGFGALPRWRAPAILLFTAVRSSSVLGHHLIHRFQAERFQVFLAGHFAMWFGAGVLLPLWEYFVLAPSRWFLVLAGVSAAHSVLLVLAMDLVRRERYEQSISLVCVGNWVGVLVVVYVSPALLPVMAVMALLPVAFAEAYVRWQRGLLFVGITGLCLLTAAVLARFVRREDAAQIGNLWVETAFVIAGLTVVGLNLMVVVWNNAAALRTSETYLAEHAVDLAASRARLAAAADDERRRIERDLHDGAQQHLVALSMLIQLARDAEPERADALLDDAAELVGTAVVEIRRLAQGIYPPQLVSGGLAGALPILAARSAIPVRLDLGDLGRHPAPMEAALYFCCSEALQNAAKHGRPDTVATVTASVDGDRLRLTIADDGPGFDPETQGRGLANMRDRISALGGDLLIDTAPGAGARVVATVKLGDPD